MKIDTTRFGTLELDEAEAIRFPAGIIGFPSEDTFVLLRKREGSPIGWLQSTRTAGLALPVVSVDALASDYEDLTIDGSDAIKTVIGEADGYAIMVVLNPGAATGMATVNLLAPIVVNPETRTGAQVLVESTAYSTQEPFALRAMMPTVSEAAVVRTTEPSRSLAHAAST
jgi:flagellar assembly factor FliW